jgi:SAM-dependent methyltransferase
MLPAELRGALRDNYADYFATYGARLEGQPATGAASKEVKGQIHVMDAFGYEWNSFADYQMDNFDEWVGPITPDFFDGKLGLDAGCGAGRHSMQAHSYGAEMVGMDLSYAVDASYGKARVTPGINIVQGDIFHPPFKPGTFEFIYSIGVIHHTPDPPRAYQSIVKVLAPGGTMIVMVYAATRPALLKLLAALRAVTTRLPLPVMKAMAWLAAAVDVVFPITAYRVLSNIGFPKKLLNRIAPEHVQIYAKVNFETCFTDWVDRFSYPYVHYYSVADVTAWEKEAGLEDIAVVQLGTYGVNGVGVAPLAAGISGASAAS